MTCRKIPFAIFLLLLLPCCAPSPHANDGISEPAAVTAALVRPPCLPPDSLMQAPQSLAALPGQLTEPAAVQAWLDDMTVYQSLRGQTGALQNFVRQNCQQETP